jgi:hypothetical protein
VDHKLRGRILFKWSDVQPYIEKGKVAKEVTKTGVTLLRQLRT